MKKRGRTLPSIKDGAGLQKNKGLDKSLNVGVLMRKYRTVEDVLFRHVINSELVYEDMDFTIEEFSDMTGADLEELLEELNEAIRVK